MTLRFHAGALKHAISPEDTLHAIRYAVQSWRQQRNTNTIAYIGPDRDGRLLEIVILELDDGDDLVIHSDTWHRNSFYPPHKR